VYHLGSAKIYRVEKKIEEGVKGLQKKGKCLPFAIIHLSAGLLLPWSFLLPAPTFLCFPW